MIIPTAQYKAIVQALPIACVDILVRNADGQFLLVKRLNEPMKGEWWVPGGRIIHGERAEEAARRKLREELGLQVDALALRGYYEDYFDRNALDVPGIYHTFSIVFEARLPESCEIVLDDQSAEWTWADALPQRLVIQPFAAAQTRQTERCD